MPLKMIILAGVACMSAPLLAQAAAVPSADTAAPAKAPFVKADAEEAVRRAASLAIREPQDGGIG